MNTVKVKICGVTDIETALIAKDSGTDFIGFIFVPRTKRTISIETAKKIRAVVPLFVKVVGVFRNQSVEEVNRIADIVGLDFVQLHGEESVAYCTQISKSIIKGFTLPIDFSVEEIKKIMQTYTVEYFLIDRETQGEGNMHDGEKVKQLTTSFKIFYSGGLTPDNVIDAVHAKPFAVDVSSGVETKGEKDHVKIQTFLAKAKGISL